MDLENFLRDNDEITKLIFDLDWTITKMIIDWSEWQKNAPDILKNTDKAIFDKYLKVKINLSQLQNEYVSKYGGNIIDEIIKYNEWFENKFRKGFEVNKDLVKTIKKLKNYDKFLWSSNTKKSVDEALEISNLKKVFKKVVTRNDVKMIKPDPEGFKLINQPKISLNHYVFIGDSGSDKKTAENLKIKFFQITFFADNISKY